jgi:hypothetical protein
MHGTRQPSTSPLKENIPSTPRLHAGVEKEVTPTSGQKLAEQFLNARRLREEMRVVSPGEGSPVSRVELGLGDLSPVFL